MILSYHNFEATPDPDYIIDTLFQAREMGADIAKVAVMPHDFENVLTLMQATLMSRKNGLKIPAIAISMGALGSLTRLAGKLFGSDITFASSETPSAPGQIPTRLLQHDHLASFPGQPQGGGQPANPTASNGKFHSSGSRLSDQWSMDSSRSPTPSIRPLR